MFLFLSPGANEDSVWNKGGKLLSSGGVFHNVLHVSTQLFLWCVFVHGVGSPELQSACLVPAKPGPGELYLLICVFFL